MEILAYFKSIAQAMLQMFLLGLVGFFLIRRKVLSSEGLNGLTNLLVEVTFPALIFWQVITKFSFDLYRNWFAYAFLSIIITVLGLVVGYIFSFSAKDERIKREFVSLVGFQNSGYLPLVLLGWLVPKEQLSNVLIYLFLFLLGFNLVFWSWGVHFLSGNKLKNFSLPSLFSPPVVATFLGFIFVALRINTSLPQFVLSPLEMLGNCSFPLAIVVVGGALGELPIYRVSDKPLVAKMLLAKLVVLPLLGLIFLKYVAVPYFLGLLIILELAMPSATSLSVIVRRYGREDKLISQGIFYSHIVSLLTLPLFLALFNWVVRAQ